MGPFIPSGGKSSPPNLKVSLKWISVSNRRLMERPPGRVFVSFLRKVYGVPSVIFNMMVTRCEYLLNRWWISICNLAAKRSLVDLFFFEGCMEGRCPGCCVMLCDRSSFGILKISSRFKWDSETLLVFFSWLVFFSFDPMGDSPRHPFPSEVAF